MLGDHTSRTHRDYTPVDTDQPGCFRISHCGNSSDGTGAETTIPLTTTRADTDTSSMQRVHSTSPCARRTNEHQHL
ncbi:predicted protein [Streptomyces lividans TK24]|nr:predicted protein [Streptomyces lividans TK24]